MTFDFNLYATVKCQTVKACKVKLKVTDISISYISLSDGIVTRRWKNNQTYWHEHSVAKLLTIKCNQKFKDKFIHFQRGPTMTDIKHISIIMKYNRSTFT